MLLNPVFNQNSDRPYRWALQVVKSGRYFEQIWMEDDRFTHWTSKPEEQRRNVYSTNPTNQLVSFTAIRKKHIGFLSTHYKHFYEDGKYLEVWNDPVNYILADATDYNEAYDFAEKRIGNYRIGVRRHITHLGGTLSDDEIDMLEDDVQVALTAFPLFPPLPAASFVKPFRTRLITSDVGYIDYIKAAHNTETTTARYAHRAEQGTGFRRFVFDAGNTNMKYESIVKNSVSKVDVDDIETVVDAGLDTQIDGTVAIGTPTLLPKDGEDILVNFPGWHLVRSNGTKYSIEMYDAADLGTLVSEISIDRATGDITVGNGSMEITMDFDGDLVITDGTRSITMDGTTVDIT